MDNKFSGDGSYLSKSFKGTYIRNMKDGKEFGLPILTLTNGDEYKGGNGGFSGFMSITFSNGDSYDGYVEDGLKSGSGTYIWASGESYKGKWSSDKMNGQGTYYPTSDWKTYYKGKFKNNKPSGSFRYYENNKAKKKKKLSKKEAAKILVPQKNRCLSVDISVDDVLIVPPKTQE